MIRVAPCCSVQEETLDHSFDGGCWPLQVGITMVTRRPLCAGYQAHLLALNSMPSSWLVAALSLMSSRRR